MNNRMKETYNLKRSRIKNMFENTSKVKADMSILSLIRGKTN